MKHVENFLVRRMSCVNIFPVIVSIAKRPKGSNILPSVDKAILPVYGMRIVSE